MNRNPYVPPEMMAEYLKGADGGKCTAQTCHVIGVIERAAPADDAGHHDANEATDKPAAIPAKKKAPAGRRKAAAGKK
ncbi:hypothetical protein [Pseudoduganella namucuonensis]|uniref:Uncharacterized protein n=1 Tax=Pseudoduganella namucuonensis TaxID=1035707 RepID=A0A1I7KQ95_9BURK|nr:hypothetical protein [Pseudoduganella namucuonensis]SFU99581.1 hypothetical protein SAMN05216552_1018128 [Pseudoduganella namucuonensis]